MPAAQKILNKKKKDADRVLKPKAKNEQDWINQELAEDEGKAKSQDYINDTVGRTLYVQQASLRAWRTKRSNGPLFVSRFYPYAPKIIIDKPHTKAELDDKAEFFKGTDIAYVGIEPLAEMTPAELKGKIREALQQLAARSAKTEPAAAAAPKVAKTGKAAPAKPAKKKPKAKR